MWSIRFLTGKQAGQVVQLQPGTTVLGRAPGCDIVVASQGVSKQHLKIDVTADKVIVTDMGSSNGTFVNGIQIRSQRIQAGDKIGAHDVIFEITDRMVKMPSRRSRPARHTHPVQTNGNLAHALPQMDAMGGHQPDVVMGAPAPQEQGVPASAGFVAFAKQYFETVVMPGVYKLAEWMEFRWVIAMFVGAFIITVTALSSFPLMRILKDSVERESSEHARNLAKVLADKNAPALKGGITSALSVEWVRGRGVDKAYVLDASGLIQAPPELANKWPSEPFVNAARKRGVSAVEVIGNNTVAAVEPIKVFNSNINDVSAMGYAVVIYNMATLEVSEGKTLSLLIQVFCLALILGFILYIFFVKLIEHPIVLMNSQVKSALGDGRTQVSTNYQFPQLQELASNVNSAVQRALSGDLNAGVGQNYELDRTGELQGIVNLVGHPAAAVDLREKSFVAANSLFQEHITRGQDWVHTKVESILEQSLRLNLMNLIDVVQMPPHTGQDELEINEVPYTISAQGVMGSKELSYLIYVFTPKAGG